MRWQKTTSLGLGTFVTIVGGNAVEPLAAVCVEPGGPSAAASARNDSANMAARPIWDQLLRQQDIAEGWPPPPFALDWTLGRDIHDAAGRPHYMKDGHGCLIDGEFMVLAGGFQCPDEHNATSPCSNLALTYSINNDTWSTIPSPPWRTGRTQGACTGSSLIFVGGQGTPSGQPTSTTPPFFNVTALSRGTDGQWAWDILPQLPSDGGWRWMASAAIVPDRGRPGTEWLMLGMGTSCQDAMRERGDGTLGSGKLSCSDAQLMQTLPTLRLALTKDRDGSQIVSGGWERAADFPGGPRNSVPSAVLGGCWYTFGGMRWPNSSTTTLMAHLDASFTGGAKTGFKMPNGDALLYPTMRDAFKVGHRQCPPQLDYLRRGLYFIDCLCFQYCPDADSWERLPGSVPIGMTGHGDGVILDGRYIVLAGSQEHITYRAGRSEPNRFPSEGESQVSRYHGWGDNILCFDTDTNKYCELQYKWPTLFEFSIENAEIMEN